MNGILNVLKPPGMTSHDVVGFVRKLTGQKKAGHTGTLDPGAAGVLPVCLGKATRIIEYLHDGKAYRAEAILGTTTTTQDAFGEILAKSLWFNIDLIKIKKSMMSFMGDIQQIPPMTSAIKHQGKKLYELARAGIEIERKPRNVHIYEMELIHFSPGDTQIPPRLVLDIKCSAGTYIRTICNDLGKMLGCGAYMSFLLRTRAGDFDINEAVTLEELSKLKEKESLDNVLVPISSALKHLPRITVEANNIKYISCGNRLTLPVNSINFTPNENHTVRIEAEAGLLAIGKVIYSEDKPGFFNLQPVKVLV